MLSEWGVPKIRNPSALPRMHIQLSHCPHEGLGWQIMSFSWPDYITSSSDDDHALIIVTKMCLFNMEFLIVWMGSLGALANIMGRRGLTVYISVLFHVLITPIFINIAHHKPSEFAVAMPIQWSSLCHILVQERVPPIWWKILHSLNRLN